MGATTQSYVLADGAVELERLTLQARTWEPEVENLLDQIGVQPGWRCLDLGCGAMGILGPLSRRVGPSGRVVGLDADAKLLAGAARGYLDQQGFQNVELTQGDAFRTNLPRNSFDLVHARFMFSPLGRHEELAREIVALTRPGGVIAVQEPISESWQFSPPRPELDRLKAAILEAFRRGGGDFNAGLQTFGLLQRAGLQNVRIRAAVLALQNGHPYMRSPALFAASLGPKLFETGLISETELAEALRECEAAAGDPQTFALTFTCTQVWGTKSP